MIKDAFCLVAEVGDTVAYAPGGAGAQEFRTGTISKITGRVVTIVNHGEVGCMGEEKIIRRGPGSFVISIEGRHEGVVGKANAWDSFDQHVRDIKGPAGRMRSQVSSQLHFDGCASAWVHHWEFVSALVEEYEGIVELVGE